MVVLENTLPEPRRSSHEIFKEALGRGGDSGKWKIKDFHLACVQFVRTDEEKQDSQRNRPCSADTCCHLRERREEGSPTSMGGRRHQ